MKKEKVLEFLDKLYHDQDVPRIPDEPAKPEKDQSKDDKP
jgi:hypothetical protein